MRNKTNHRPMLALLPFLLLVSSPTPAGAGQAVPAASGDAAPAAELPVGTGVMQAALPGGETIKVFTYRAASHGPDDPILVVLPGAGRNGDDYRDSWIEAAERHDLLVLSPAFDETQFPGPISYNLGGMIAQGADPATLEDIQVTAPPTWIHADIEAIFEKYSSE